MIDKYYKGNNFWECFPEYKILDTFEEFSRKKISSNIMWAITFCMRKESPMYNLPNKWELAQKDIVKDNKFKWDDYEDIVSLFKQTCMSQAERSLLAWEELMVKRDKYLKNQEYYFDEYLTDENGDNVKSRMGQFIVKKGTADQLDRAFGVTPKMYSDFAKIKKEVIEDEIKRGRGNKVKSLSDSGEI
jgi:hypothetical protein